MIIVGGGRPERRDPVEGHGREGSGRDPEGVGSMSHVKPKTQSTANPSWTMKKDNKMRLQLFMINAMA